MTPGTARGAPCSVGEGGSYTTDALGLLLVSTAIVRLGLGRFAHERLWCGERGLPHVPRSRLDLRERRLLPLLMELVLMGPTVGSP